LAYRHARTRGMAAIFGVYVRPVDPSGLEAGAIGDSGDRAEQGACIPSDTVGPAIATRCYQRGTHRDRRLRAGDSRISSLRDAELVPRSPGLMSDGCREVHSGLTRSANRTKPAAPLFIDDGKLGFPIRH